MYVKDTYLSLIIMWYEIYRYVNVQKGTFSVKRKDDWHFARFLCRFALLTLLYIYNYNTFFMCVCDYNDNTTQNIFCSLANFGVSGKTRPISFNFHALDDPWGREDPLPRRSIRASTAPRTELRILKLRLRADVSSPIDRLSRTRNLKCAC